MNIRVFFPLMITLNDLYSEGNDSSRLFQRHCNIINCLWDIVHFLSAQSLFPKWLCTGLSDQRDIRIAGPFHYVFKYAAVWCTLLWIYRLYIWMNSKLFKKQPVSFLKYSTLLCVFLWVPLKTSSVIQRAATLEHFTFHKCTNHSKAGGSLRWAPSLLVMALSASLKVSFQ